MADNKAAAGPILSFVGGVVILAYGAYELYVAETVQALSSLAGFPVNGSLDGFINGGTVGIVLGILLVIISIALAAAPDLHVALGVAIISLSLLSLVSLGGGEGFGMLLGVLGGTCAIVLEPEGITTVEDRIRIEFGSGTQAKGPIPAQEPPPSPPLAPRTKIEGRTHQGCPNCGKIIPMAFTTCPNCGSKI